MTVNSVRQSELEIHRVAPGDSCISSCAIVGCCVRTFGFIACHLAPGAGHSANSGVRSGEVGSARLVADRFVESNIRSYNVVGDGDDFLCRAASSLGVNYTFLNIVGIRGLHIGSDSPLNFHSMIETYMYRCGRVVEVVRSDDVVITLNNAPCTNETILRYSSIEFVIFVTGADGAGLVALVSLSFTCIVVNHDANRISKALNRAADFLPCPPLEGVCTLHCKTSDSSLRLVGIGDYNRSLVNSCGSIVASPLALSVVARLDGSSFERYHVVLATYILGSCGFDLRQYREVLDGGYYRRFALLVLRNMPCELVAICNIVSSGLVCVVCAYSSIRRIFNESSLRRRLYSPPALGIGAILSPNVLSAEQYGAATAYKLAGNEFGLHVVVGDGDFLGNPTFVVLGVAFAPYGPLEGICTLLDVECKAWIVGIGSRDVVGDGLPLAMYIGVGRFGSGEGVFCTLNNADICVAGNSAFARSEVYDSPGRAAYASRIVNIDNRPDECIAAGCKRSIGISLCDRCSGCRRKVGRSGGAPVALVLLIRRSSTVESNLVGANLVVVNKNLCFIAIIDSIHILACSTACHLLRLNSPSEAYLVGFGNAPDECIVVVGGSFVFRQVVEVTCRTRLGPIALLYGSLADYAVELYRTIASLVVGSEIVDNRLAVIEGDIIFRRAILGKSAFVVRVMTGLSPLKLNLGYTISQSNAGDG